MTQEENKQQKMEPDQQKEEPSGMSGYALGMNLVVSVLVGCAMGYGLDIWLGTLPLFMLLFLVLGFVAGLRNIWLALERDRPNEK